MSYYTELKIEKINLRKDTPENVVVFLNDIINNEIFDRPNINHPLFDCERWDHLFIKSAFLPHGPSLKKLDSGYFELGLWTDINHGIDEINQLIDWITPFVAGRKKHFYIGYYKGETDEKRTNIYIR